jgi:hypothetical protein
VGQNGRNAGDGAVATRVCSATRLRGSRGVERAEGAQRRGAQGSFLSRRTNPAAKAKPINKMTARLINTVPYPYLVTSTNGYGDQSMMAPRPSKRGLLQFGDFATPHPWD